MAEATTDDDLERGAAGQVEGGGRGGGVPLADEGADELPAFLAFAVGIAILTIGLIWPTIDDRHAGNGAGAGTGTDAVAEAEADDETAAADGDEPTADAEDDGAAAGADDEAALPDIPAIQGLIDGEADGVAVSGDGTTVFLVGTVADEATGEALVALAAAQPNVAAVDATGLQVVPAADAAVDVAAAQVSIVLTGTVPDEATRAAIVERAVAVYDEDQVDDQLVVDDAAQPPTRVAISGSMTDPILHAQVLGAFDGIDGVELGDTAGFVLEESSDLEAALNALAPIEFASGSAIVEPESASILDEAAELLAANPDVALEIGGHTDSLGGDEANQTLSEARARAVLGELQDRGVTNELTAVGFGERRLKVSPDDNDPAAQQENRRIEFRIIS